MFPLLQEYRKKHGLTQAALAQKVGITQGAVSHIETGRMQISATLAADLEAVSGGELSFAKLWTRTRHPETAS